MKKFITQYVKGCPKCQETKSNTTKPKIPTYPITVKPNAQPFETIAWDLITDLPLSNRHDSILTITDHDCTKAAIFLPCNKRYRLRRNRHAICHTRLPTLRRPPKDHLGPRSTLRIKVQQGTMRAITNRTKHQHSLPPTDGRPIRTIKSVARAIPQDLWQLPTR